MTNNHEIFYGSNVKQLPMLLAKGVVPVSTAYIMKQRIEGEKDFVENYWDTSDLVAYDSKKNKGDVKFILTVDNNNQITEQGRKVLELIHYNNPLIEGAIKIDDQYKDLKADGIIVVPRKKLGKVESRLTESEILDSKPWRILARHPGEVEAEFAEDEKLLGEYLKWVQSQTKDTKNMGVYLDSQGKNAKLRAWFVGGPVSRSVVSGRGSLDFVLGRFAGISGGAAESAQNNVLGSQGELIIPSLEQILEFSKQHVSEAGREAFEKGLRELYQEK